MSSNTGAQESNRFGSSSPAISPIGHGQRDQFGIPSSPVDQPSGGPLHPAGTPVPERGATYVPLHPQGTPPSTSSQLTPENRDSPPRPGPSSVPIHGDISSESFSSQQGLLPTHAHTRVDLQPETTQSHNFDRDSQETIIRARASAPTRAAHSQDTISSRPPSVVDLSHSTRPRQVSPTRSESSQQPTQIRILSDSELTRSPVHSRQLRSNATLSQEGHGISDSEAETELDQRRVLSHDSLGRMRRHYPLPPLPRVTSPGVPQPPSPSHHTRRPQSSGSAGGPSIVDRSSNLAGIGSRGSMIVGSFGPSAGAPGATAASGGPGPEISGNANGENHTSIAPGLATVASHPTLDRSRTLRSGVDWIVPLEDKTREKTVGERLDPTLDTARIERDKYALKAKMTSYSLNIAIGLQVVLGALTTGLSAATTGRQTSIMTAILGGLATMVASYLARARGSHEPELSTARVKDLDQFIRECETYKLDYGHLKGSTNPEQHTRLDELRDRFEELLGNVNEERRLAPPA